jgi:hypothetical protein
LGGLRRRNPKKPRERLPNRVLRGHQSIVKVCPIRNKLRMKKLFVKTKPNQTKKIERPVPTEGGSEIRHNNGGRTLKKLSVLSLPKGEAKSAAVKADKANLNIFLIFIEAAVMKQCLFKTIALQPMAFVWQSAGKSV